MSNPTKLEKAFWNALCNYVGCIACRIDGVENHNVSIHHIDGRTKEDAHKNVLPLCFGHHQGGTMESPSVHPWKRRFEDKYGDQYSLLDMCKKIVFK